MKRIFLIFSAVILCSIFMSAVLYAQDQPGKIKEGGKLNKAGIKLGEKKQYDKAVDEFDRALKIFQFNEAKVYHNKAWAQQLKGDTVNAVKNYEEALKRNPKLIPSGENLGLIYYTGEDYDNAVRIGEQVLQFDPDNKEVKKWLPDALAKRNKNKELKDKELQDKKDLERKDIRTLTVMLDVTVRTGFFFESQSYKYISDAGTPMSIPYTVFASFTPTSALALNITVGNPNLGALTPRGMVMINELFEAQFRLGNFTLGAGLMATQYHSEAAFYTDLRLSDLKVGLIFGYKKDDLELKFTFYPRFIPYDGPGSRGHTLDTAMFRVDYTYTINQDLVIYSLFYFRDYFVFWHQIQDDGMFLQPKNAADYWGVYDIGLGATLGKIIRYNNRRDFAFSVEFLARFYLRNLNNLDPYTRAPNGQGYFGLGVRKWFKGNVFPGYRTMNYVIGFRVEEELFDFLFLYQKLSIELCDIETEHHEFDFQIGVGLIL